MQVSVCIYMHMLCIILSKDCNFNGWRPHATARSFSPDQDAAVIKCRLYLQGSC